MKTIALIVGIIALAGLCILALDMLRFKRAKHKAENPKAGQFRDLPECVLYIDSNRTYWRDAKGTVHKVADYPMDLRPGSQDMAMFTHTLDKARMEHEAEVRAQKGEAVENMAKIAKEEAAK